MSILFNEASSVLYLSLNRPDAGNRIDQATIEALTAEFERVNPLEGGPAVIVLGAVGPDFSLGRQRSPDPSFDPLDLTAEFERIQRLNEAVQRCRAVTIAVIRGRAEGAGLSLAARCDIVLVANDALLSFPEIPHGIPPTIVLSHYRYVLPRNLLGDLIYTGRALVGSEAVQAGLAARAVESKDLDDLAARLAGQIAGYDRRSIALVKQFLARTEGLPAPHAPALGISLYANEMSHRDFAKRPKDGS
ncbi:enoyl-CoA hydratase/isomerase family protein [Pseudochelatococcus sp. B33]